MEIGGLNLETDGFAVRVVVNVAVAAFATEYTERALNSQGVETEGGVAFVTYCSVGWVAVRGVGY